MLDKTVPYFQLRMRRRARTPTTEFPLPEGFRFVFYTEGDESVWAAIEDSVGEFDSEFAALIHFKKKFTPYPEELSRRLFFIENSDGKKVATACAWWSYIEGERRAWLHWVAVNPKSQGLGLGKALISRATELFKELDGDVDVYLNTQTWSYKAINIYVKCGFEPTDEKILYHKGIIGHYKKALKTLKKLRLAKGWDPCPG